MSYFVTMTAAEKENVNKMESVNVKMDILAQIAAFYR